MGASRRNAGPDARRGRYPARMHRRTVALASLVLASLLAPLGADPAEHEKILAGMKKLAPLVGTWDAVWRFHGKDGVTERVGTHVISLTLDDTYLEWKVECHPKDNPKARRSFVVYTTFDPRKNRYDQTYFYSRSALRVVEIGDFDDAAGAFRTTAYISLEDDVRDENVRKILTFPDSDHALYRHWSRYSDEKTERMDLEIELTRR